MSIEKFLEHSAERYPHKLALIGAHRRLTFRETDQYANRLAHALLGAAVQPGDRVAIFMDNAPEAVVALLAVLKAGATFVIVNPTTKAGKLAEILNDCAASVLLTQSDKLEVVAAVWDRIALRSIFSIGNDAVLPDGALSMEAVFHSPNGSDWRPAVQVASHDLAALIYTSGSTGQPKGVMLTRANLMAVTDSITSYLEAAHDDVILSVLPLSFGYGLTQVMIAFSTGATLVLERSFAFPHVVLETLRREQATAMALVPTMSAVLLHLDLQKYQLSSLRYITNAAAAWPVEHMRKWRQILPQAKLFSMYGQTECLRVTYLPPDQVDIRPASVGRGMPNQEFCLVDEEGRSVGPGKIGELVICGPHVMRGYWGAPDETARKLREGPWPGRTALFSGDLFRMDEEGYLYFVSRQDDIIKTRGEKVSPREIEDLLYELDGVVEVAVVGVPDKILGQAIRVIVVVKEGASLTERDILFHCKRCLEDYMMPKSVVIGTQPLPKTASGKILKRELVAPS